MAGARPVRNSLSVGGRAMRRRLSVLVAMAVMLAMASLAFADPGNGKGFG